MNWGNTTLLAGTTLRDMEDIFVDDVQDGMASMADEMASGATIFFVFPFLFFFFTGLLRFWPPLLTRSLLLFTPFLCSFSLFSYVFGHHYSLVPSFCSSVASSLDAGIQRTSRMWQRRVGRANGVLASIDPIVRQSDQYQSFKTERKATWKNGFNQSIATTNGKHKIL